MQVINFLSKFKYKVETNICILRDARSLNLCYLFRFNFDTIVLELGKDSKTHNILHLTECCDKALRFPHFWDIIDIVTD